MPGSRDLGLKNLSAWDGFPLLCARPKKTGATSALPFPPAKPPAARAPQQLTPPNDSGKFPKSDPFCEPQNKPCGALSKAIFYISARYQLKNTEKHRGHKHLSLSVKPSHHNSSRLSSKGRRHRSRNLQLTRCQNSLVPPVLWKCAK